MEYKNFLAQLDQRLEKYFLEHKNYIQCKKGCSFCCEKGDYPITQMELEYLMQGYIALSDNEKQIVQKNIKTIKKGGACPFLINQECSIYQYRPIICRTHGLAYLCRKNLVKVPFCVHNDKNYSEVFYNGEITINPVLENLDTTSVLKEFNYGEIRNLYDWLKQ